LAQLFALPDVGAGPDAVEIMTIHKAKGLEFDTVIVPGLDRPPRSTRRPLFAWRALPGGQLLIAPIDETGGEQEPLYKYVRLLDREAEDIEAARLLYVAATRAKSRLHLLGCVKIDEHGVLKLPAKRSLLGLAWSALGEGLRLPAAAAAPEKRGSLPAGELRRLPADFAMPEPPAGVAWRTKEEVGEETQVEFSWVGETARHVGSVTHRWLQRIAEDSLAGWDERRVRALSPRVRAALAVRGVGEDGLDSACERVIAALANSISSERGRWVLGAHSKSASEYRIVALLDGVPTRLVIDRYFETSSGEKWVVDYKTSTHTGGSVEAFLDRERERYAEQLARYVRAMGGAGIRAGLYFPLLGGWREV
jgi:ATP-dependent exoDNAse (exonuclease V) beta subunit